MTTLAILLPQASRGGAEVLAFSLSGALVHFCVQGLVAIGAEFNEVPKFLVTNALVRPVMQM